MFDFVWHLRGSVALKHNEPNVVVFDRLEYFLEKQRKSERKRNSEHLGFDTPLWKAFFGPNWLAMVIYDHGQFWIEQGPDERRLRYDLRSLHAIAFCLFAAFLAFFFGLAGGGLAGGAKVAIGAFTWLYGMNILLALFRVPLAIHKAVVTA